MSREIKFCAWDSLNRKMYLNPINSRIGNINQVVFGEHGDWEYMQFTGLLDSKGKEIYEGDILKFTSLVCFSSKKGSIYEDAIAEVIWSIGGAGFTPHVLSGHLHSFDMTKGEVIGNIFENPELKKIPMKFAECVFCDNYNNKLECCEDITSYNCTKGKHSVHPGHFIQKDL